MATFGKTAADSRKRLATWVNEKVAPVMGKIGNQTHLTSLRDGFALLLPLIIASAVALILATSVFGAFGTERSSLLGVFAKWGGTAFVAADGSLTSYGKASGEMGAVLGAMNNLGLGLLAVYFTFGFGFFLSKSRGNNSPEIGGLVALGCFFIATAGGQSSARYINLAGAPVPLVGDGFMGSNGLFAAIVVTIISVEFYCWLSNVKRLEIRLPEGVPPAVSRSFAKLVPVIGSALLITTLLGIVAIPTHLANAEVLTSQRNVATNAVVVGISAAAPNSYYNIGDLVFMAVQSPFIYAATIQGANLGIAVLYTLLVGLFWFFGIHGPNVVGGIFNAVWLALLANNVDLLKQGHDALVSQGSVFVYGTFDVFIQYGGSGATLPLILGTLMFGKNAQERAIARFSIPSGVFQINEPVLFGYPIVANFRYFVPFVLVMPIMAVLTWVFYQAFGTTPIAVQVPWTTPIGIGALFATQFDYTSFFIALINTLASFLVWAPFILLSNRREKITQTNIALQAKAATA